MNETVPFVTKPAIVLAAGAGSRFGSQKLVANVRGKPLIRHVVEAVIRAGFRPVIVVIAPDSTVETALVGLDVRFAVNKEAGTGIASSIRTGLRAVYDTASAALLVLGDQPALREEHLRQLATVHSEGMFPIIASDYQGISAPPVLFDRAAFDELLALQGDRGAKEILDRSPDRVARVAVHADFVDVDTPDDLQKFEGV